MDRLLEESLNPGLTKREKDYLLPFMLKYLKANPDCTGKQFLDAMIPHLERLRSS